MANRSPTASPSEQDPDALPGARSVQGERSPVVLLTGASAGLGLAIARQLLPTPYRLILTARAASLIRFAREGISESPRVWLRALDVTNAGDRERVVAEALERWDGVDMLINNAGIAFRSVLEHASESDLAAQFSVNFAGPLELIRLVLPQMRARRAGRIINISSVGGMMAMPTMGPYSASKFALEGATEALWYETRPFGIRVSLVEPGFIHSASFLNTRYSAQAAASHSDSRDAYHICYQRMADFIARRMQLARATPEHVARVVVRTLRRRHPPLRVHATIDAKVFSWLRRFLPRRLYHAVLYRALPGVERWGVTDCGSKVHQPVKSTERRSRRQPTPYR